MRLPRMTTRRWMVVVAVVAPGTSACVETIRLRQLSVYYGFRARRAAWKVRLYSQGLERGFMNYDLWCPADFCRREVAINAPLRLKYALAARYPWLPVKPDPPLPK